MRPDTLAALQVARSTGQPAVVITDIDGTGQWLFTGPAPQWQWPSTLSAAVRAVAADALRSGVSRQLDDDGRHLFVHVFPRPMRVIIIGAVHIAQALAAMSQRLDWQVTVIDPRSAFATSERFPGVDLRIEWPQSALDQLQPDERTAVVTLTHDAKVDEPALVRALQSPAFYIGALGSRRTHARRVERLRGAGVDDAAIGRVHAPIGLAIGAVTPAEIALSIMAEITATLRGASASR